MNARVQNLRDEEVREIRTIEQAIAWGDEWEAAYRAERRQHLRDLIALEDKIFWLEHALSVVEFERFLEEAKKRMGTTE